MRASRVAFLASSLISLLGVASCVSSDDEMSLYLHPNMDFSTIERVAVLPLVNMSTDRFASDRIREVVTVELLAFGFDVIETGQTNRALAQSSVADLTMLTPEDLSTLATSLDAQAILVGSVMDYRERRVGNFAIPEVALSLRLVDGDSGLAVWSVSDARSGVNVWTRLFGLREESMTDAVRILIRQLLPTLFDEVV